MARGVKSSESEATVVLAGAEETVVACVGEWNRLVSRTNWEKGRIICQWREALVSAGAAVSEYSDEAWAQLVGGVTSQHVGRLRRVHQRFGEASGQYDGLYWSHFQAAIDWEDAEMWLEGAIHNRWSVSQMRGKRWETVGKPGEPFPADDQADGEATSTDAPWLEDDADAPAETSAAVSGEESAIESRASRGDSDSSSGHEPGESASDEAAEREAPPSTAKARTRLAVEVDELPDDLADAFEQFKLAIIAQRRLGWSETTPEAVIECLDALRQLALAPADD